MFRMVHVFVLAVAAAQQLRSVNVDQEVKRCKDNYCKARWTYYESYPCCCSGYPAFYRENCPNKDECSMYGGCQWVGAFAYPPIAGQWTYPYQWVKSNAIVAFKSNKLGNDETRWRNKRLLLKYRTTRVCAQVIDTCSDGDCAGCNSCSRGAADGGGYLIDIEINTLENHFGPYLGELQGYGGPPAEGSGPAMVEWKWSDCTWNDSWETCESKDEDCGQGETCRNNRCYKTCSSDEDCEGCRDGICQGTSPTPTPAPPTPSPEPSPSPPNGKCTASECTASWGFWDSYPTCCQHEESYDHTVDTCDHRGECHWVGQFAFLNGKKSLAWVKSMPLVSFTSKTMQREEFALRTMKVSYGRKTVCAKVVSTCGGCQFADEHYLQTETWTLKNYFGVDRPPAQEVNFKFDDCNWGDSWGSPAPTPAPTYKWQKGSWGACSKACGGGQQTRTVQCVTSEGDKVAHHNCAGSTPVESRRCNTDPCPSPAPTPTAAYTWQTYGWSHCSKTCGRGQQTRVVYCAQTGWRAADSKCNGHQKPVESRPCNKDPCPGYPTPAPTPAPTYKWQEGSWGACSKACGSGQKTRTVHCVTSEGDKVVHSKCAGQQKPVESRPCNTHSCPSPAPTPTSAYTWQTYEWGNCPVTCGGGQQTRVVYCAYKTLWAAWDHQCAIAGQQKPVESRRCNTHPCP